MGGEGDVLRDENGEVESAGHSKKLDISLHHRASCRVEGEMGLELAKDIVISEFENLTDLKNEHIVPIIDWATLDQEDFFLLPSKMVPFHSLK